MKALTVLLLFFSLAIVSTSQTPSPSEKPSDVEILKFSWAERSRQEPGNRSAGGTLDPSQRAPDRGATADYSAVAARRIEQQTSTRANDAVNAETPKSKIINYVFTISIKNTGVKTIQDVEWAYFLFPKDPAGEPVGWLFKTAAKIEPGKKKSLHDTSILVGELMSRAKTPSNATRSSFNDKAVLVHVNYTDGSTWNNPSNVQVPPPRKQ